MWKSHASSSSMARIPQLGLTMDQRSTPLHVASRLGGVGVVQSLIEHGADVRAEDKDGLSRLDLASRETYTDVERLLLARDLCLCAIIYRPAHTPSSRAYPTVVSSSPCSVSLDAWGTHGLSFSADIQVNRHYDGCHATNSKGPTALEGKGPS